MSETLQFMASIAAGSLLGVIFLLGLWMTLHHLEKSRHPTFRLLASLLLRLGLVCVLFYLLARYQGWQHLLAATAGFILVRIVIIQRVRPRSRVYLTTTRIKKGSATPNSCRTPPEG